MTTLPPKNQNPAAAAPFNSFFSMQNERGSLSPPSSAADPASLQQNNQSPRMGGSTGQYAPTGASHSSTASRSSLSPGYSGYSGQYGASEGISSHTTPSYDMDLPFDISSPKNPDEDNINAFNLSNDQDQDAIMRQFDFSIPMTDNTQTQTQTQAQYNNNKALQQAKQQNSLSSTTTVTTGSSSNAFLPSPTATNSPLSSRQFASPEAMNMQMSSPIVKVEDHDMANNSNEGPRTRTRTDDRGANLNRVLPAGGDDNEQWRGRRAIAPGDEVPSLNDSDMAAKDMESRQTVVDWLQRSFAPGQTVVGESGRKPTGLTVDTSGRMRSRSVGDWRSLEQEAPPQRPEEVFPNNNNNNSNQMQMGEADYPFNDGTPRAIGDVLYEDDETSEEEIGSGDNDNESDGLGDAIIPEEEYQLMPNGLTNDFDPEAIAPLDVVASSPPPHPVDQYTPGPAPEDTAMEEAAEAYPDPKRFYSKRAQPWFDPPSGLSYQDRMYGKTSNQPPTAQAAIEMWQRANHNIETASRVATFGSIAGRHRRLSAGEVEGLFKRMSFGKNDETLSVVKRPGAGASGERTPSLFELPKNVLKRFASSGSESHRPVFGSFSGLGTSGGSFSPDAKTSRKESLKGRAAGAPSRIKSLTRKGSKKKKEGAKMDTSTALAGMINPLVGVGSAAAAAGRTSPPRHGDIKFGVASLIKGANAVASAAGGGAATSPSTHRHASKDSLSVPPMHQHDDESSADEEAPAEPVVKRTPSIPPRVERIVDPIHPSRSGFAKHCRQLNPQLPQRLVDRIALEQVKRYKKLLECYKKHSTTVMSQNCCTNGQRCSALVTSAGGGFGDFSANGPNSFGAAGDQIDYDSDDSTGEGMGAGESNVAAAQFPPGVPVPPVSRLPADFECTICFKIKKFNKPSDWTKHVHEDVQPFTCTFPECTEPKSFKRKADWVRHENEKHRHLEWWACNLPDCQHKCYRKDNFVQHLVREHKMPEPKVKAAKAAAAAAKSSASSNKKKGKGDEKEDEINKVWRIVEACHRETDKLPTSEPCRFCGLKCGTWKKLTVHLARHMEEISLPVLKLITDDAVLSPLSARGNSTTTSPVNQIGGDLPSAVFATASLTLGDNSAVRMELDMLAAQQRQQQEEHERQLLQGMHMHTPPEHYISSESVSPVASLHSHHSGGVVTGYPQQYLTYGAPMQGGMQSLDAAVTGLQQQYNPMDLGGGPLGVTGFGGYHDPNALGVTAGMATGGGPQYVTAAGMWGQQQGQQHQQQHQQQPMQQQQHHGQGNDDTDTWVDWSGTGQAQYH